MRVSDAFPSRFLRATDIEGKWPMRVTMDKVVQEDVTPSDQPSEYKPVCYFLDMEAGLVLNKTNASMIAHFYGDEMDDWSGKDIDLVIEPVTFKGKPVDAIRVRRPSGEARTADGEEVPF